MPLTPTSAQQLAQHIGATVGLVEIAGHQIYYEVAGEGLPIVFLHDGILHSRAFDAQFTAFAATHTVIRYDRQGYGNSPPATVAYSEVATLHALFEFLGLPSAILIAGSAGGRLALNFALTYPDCVAALVVVGALVSGFDITEHMWSRGGRRDWPETLPGMIDFWATDPWLIAEENTPARDRLRQLLEAHPDNMLPPTVEQLPDVVALPRLAEIQTPTLILMGESDIPDNHAHAGVIQVGIPDSERKIIPHAGHLLYLEQPEKFNEIVTEFLKRRIAYPV